MTASPARLRIGVDIGGTFTDFVVLPEDPGASGEEAGEGRDGPGRLRTLKLLSTPEDPSRAVLEGLRRLAGELPAGEAAREPGERLSVVHGSTVATNAVLEREGAATAFVTTAGFRDLLSIGRQVRPELYDFYADPAPPLVPEEFSFELEERVDPEGRVLEAPADEELEELADALAGADVESVAVCFLYSFLRPEHERRVAERLRREGLHVSCSSRVLPEFREYERASTTTVNAYVSPVLDRYLGRLREGLPEGASLRVMQSNGGSVSVEGARGHGVRSVLSGPAAGVVGALYVAEAAGRPDVLSFDMGGTSTDVSLARGEPRVTSEAGVGGVPVAVPVVDLHTVGSGGGSIARPDPGGALRVGPKSAGARPGPVCYGRGGEAPTVTDAHLVLGRLAPDRFLGGRIELASDRAEEALARLAEGAGVEVPAGLTAGQAAAAGVVRVANAHMERALRVISVERGHDPADFVLVSFGGAGGLHACDLARRLGVGEVLLPPAASTLSALGMLAADVVRDYAQTVMRGGDVTREELEARFEPLLQEARDDLRAEEVPKDRISLERQLDVRYRGQSYELSVPFGDGWRERFHREHERVYGHAEPGAPLQVVNARVRGVGRVDPPRLPEAAPGPSDPSSALLGERPVVLGLEAGEPRVEEVPFYEAEALRPGHVLPGPGVVVRKDTTLFLSSSDQARVGRLFNLRVEVRAAGGEDR